MRYLYISFALLTLATLAAAAPPATQPAASRVDLEKSFEKTMSDATLAGSFSIKGKDSVGSDRYTLGSVTKKDGDNWIFVATIQYAGHSVALPLEIPVKWAGDTPVITVDNMGIPGLGTYTARVMVFGDQYVGIWGSSDGSHGGQMWGHVEHAAATQPAVKTVK